MRFIIPLLMTLMFFGVFIAGVIYLIAKTFFQMASVLPGSKAWDTILRSLRAIAQKHRPTLVPWDREMLPLVSLNQSETRKNGFFNPVRSGVFTTIYQEPVISFVGQISGKNALMLAQTSDREFVFRRKNKETEIWVNGAPLGVLVDGAFLAPGRGSKLLARLDARAGESQTGVLLGDKTAASLVNPGVDHASPNPRALTLLRDLNQDEENLVLALAILKMTGA